MKWIYTQFHVKNSIKHPKIGIKHFLISRSWGRHLQLIRNKMNKHFNLLDIKRKLRGKAKSKVSFVTYLKTNTLTEHLILKVKIIIVLIILIQDYLLQKQEF